MAEGDLDVYVLSRPEAQAVRDTLEANWKAYRVQLAAELAGVYTLAKMLTPDELLQIFGPELVERYRVLAQDVKRLHDAARMLDQGKAVLVPYRDTTVPAVGMINVAVVRRDALPKGQGELAYWPIFVALAVGVVIVGTVAGAAVLISKFDYEIQMARINNESLRVDAAIKAGETARAMAAKDPAAAARFIEASQKALANARAAATDPRGWLDKMFGSIEAATTPLVWLAGLYLVSRIIEKSGGYGWTRRRLAA